ncbi:MAG: hypothetical protein ABSD50_17090 [Smithella sp.]|jgi:hypothetical protein
MDHYKLFIDGEFVEAANGDVFETIDLMSINSREAQKFRNRSIAIHLDIQDKIRRQVPDIIYLLWNKSHLNNLDIQDEIVIKPFKTTLLLAC